uniref:MFS domain-containing protein n=1 Tax=Elaeophora elaphi TaxID=1147741 RepID=A0A0R3S4C1_9BILA
MPGIEIHASHMHSSDEANLSLTVGCKKLSNDIGEKCYKVKGHRAVVRQQKMGISKEVGRKFRSRSYENLSSIAKKTKFTFRSLRIANEWSPIAPSFVSIAGQKPTEFSKLTIPHIPCASPKSHGGYGSIHVKVQNEKLQEKSSADSRNESLDGGIAKRKCHGITNGKSYETRFDKLLSLTTREWMTICMLSVANLGSTSAYSCIAPFYSAEAKLKGLRSFETGVVFGVFELIMFFVAPLFGKYMVLIGSKKMFVFGIGVTGITVILFGFLNYIESSSLFFWSSIGLRILEALGDAAFITSSFAIGVKCFPGRIAIVVGVLETFVGLGSTAGPLFGGVLYELGGFQLPFFVLGIILLFLGLLAHFLIENMDDEIAMDGKGMLGILKIPVLWVMIYSVVMCAISLSFLDPTLADHLESFKLTPSIVGLMFLLSGGIYTITAPFWSIIIDRFNCSKSIITFGIVAVVIGMIVIGPSPFLNTEKSLGWIEIALGILGIAASALYIPAFQMSIEALREYGYDESVKTYACISGLFQSAYSFGSFIGPTLGGLCVQWIGFPWTTTIIALFNVIFIIAIPCFHVTYGRFGLCSRSKSDHNH